MHRLLQGDVGAGKTVVALASAPVRRPGRPPGRAHGPDRGARRAALPGGSELPRGLGGRGPEPASAERARSRWHCSRAGPPPASARGSSPSCSPAASTSSSAPTPLLTDDVRFRSLGVVVIDEQHRFGVEQRAALREKGPAVPGAGGGAEAGARHPDVLVMTATPIPRTAAMTVYGDLDQTVLDELPAGQDPGGDRLARTGRARSRPPGTGCARRSRPGARPTSSARSSAAGSRRTTSPSTRESPSRMRTGARVGAGGAAPPGAARRARVGARAAPKRPRSVVEEHARLVAGELAGLAVGLLHGQLPSKEKEATMAAFRRGELQVLVATTVIEVGVDVRERDRDGDRGRRPVRDRPAAPAAGPGRARRATSRGATCSPTS